MLFFTRAFLCIGTIVVLAEGVGPADLLRGTRDATSALAPAALAPVAALCRDQPDTCLAIAAATARATPVGDADVASPPPAMRPRPAGARRGAGKLPELSSRPLAPR